MMWHFDYFTRKLAADNNSNKFRLCLLSHHALVQRERARQARSRVKSITHDGETLTSQLSGFKSRLSKKYVYILGGVSLLMKPEKLLKLLRPIMRKLL